MSRFRGWGAVLAIGLALDLWGSANAGTIIGSWEVGDYPRPDGSKSAVARSTGPAVDIDGEAVTPRLIIECEAAPTGYGRVYILLEKGPVGTASVGSDNLPVAMTFTPGVTRTVAFRPLATRSAMQNWAAVPPFVRDAVNSRLVTVVVQGRSVTFDTTGLSEVLRFLDYRCEPRPEETSAPSQGAYEGAWYLTSQVDYDQVRVENAVVFADRAAPAEQRTSIEMICAKGRRAELIWALPETVRFTGEGDVTVSVDGAPPVRVQGWRDEFSGDYTSYPDQPFSGLAPLLRNARTATFRWNNVSATFDLAGTGAVLRRLAAACELDLNPATRAS